MRQNATGMREIEARHGAPILTYATTTAKALAAELAQVRRGYEINEIYVRTPSTDGYEPIAPDRHLFGDFAVCVRHYDPSDDVRVVGIMMTKDEADAVPEVLTPLMSSLDVLYYFAGDTLTAKAIVDHAKSGWARAVAVPDLPHADGLRQYLLEAARADAIGDRDRRPMWVMVVQGDEIYHDDLRRHIVRAQRERATVMTCQVATFLLHESQRENWDWTQPLDQRLNHYIWDFGEHTGFLDFPWIYYDPSEHMRAHPHGIFPGQYASARPVRKHYPFRSPEQARARIVDRLRTTETHPAGWQPHYQNYRDIFLSGEAAGRKIREYQGDFPEAERADGFR